MDHKEVVERNITELYLRQELSHSDEIAFEKHLLFCANCRKDLVVLESVSEGIERRQLNEFRGRHEKKKSGSHLPNIFKIPSFRISALFVLLLSIAGIVALIFKKEQTEPALLTITQNAIDSSRDVVYQKNVLINDSVSGIRVKERQDYLSQYADNFLPSPFYENIIENKLRSSEITVMSPVNDTLHQQPVFKWSDAKIRQLLLVIFSNREIQLYKSQIMNGAKIDLAIKPGLYYWQLQDTTETLITGKFIYLPPIHR
jgi:hypothetical protein